MANVTNTCSIHRQAQCWQFFTAMIQMCALLREDARLVVVLDQPRTAAWNVLRPAVGQLMPFLCASMCHHRAHFDDVPHELRHVPCSHGHSCSLAMTKAACWPALLSLYACARAHRWRQVLAQQLHDRLDGCHNDAAGLWQRHIHAHEGQAIVGHEGNEDLACKPWSYRWGLSHRSVKRNAVTAVEWGRHCRLHGQRAVSGLDAHNLAMALTPRLPGYYTEPHLWHTP